MLKKVVFKLYATFFTLVAQSFTRKFDILSNQVSGNFVVSSALNYGLALGLPFLIHVKNRFNIWTCGCLRKHPRGKIEDFKEKMLHDFSDGVDSSAENREFESVFDEILLNEDQRKMRAQEREKRKSSSGNKDKKKEESMNRQSSIFPKDPASTNIRNSELPPLNLKPRLTSRASFVSKKPDSSVERNNANFGVNKMQNIRRRLGEGRNIFSMCSPSRICQVRDRKGETRRDNSDDRYWKHGSYLLHHSGYLVRFHRSVQSLLHSCGIFVLLYQPWSDCRDNHIL